LIETDKRCQKCNFGRNLEHKGIYCLFHPDNCDIIIIEVFPEPTGNPEIYDYATIPIGKKETDA